MRRIGPVAAAVIAAGAVVLSSRAEPVPAAPVTPTRPAAMTVLGNNSCGGLTCHGNPNAESLTRLDAKYVWKSSFTHWNAVDPHRKAYEALSSNLAITIMDHLRARGGGPVLAAAEDARCLACHANPSLSPTDSMALLHDGVGCESCHGNARDWRAAHTAWTPSNRTTELAKTHFRDLKDPATRAQVCAGCHIGAAGTSEAGLRDMNHDMIAAGHPALTKTMEQLNAGLLPHWSVKAFPEPVDKTTFATFLQDLSKDRRKRHEAKDPRTPWPEFAEQDCKQCHHALK